jgi:NitT/TauT family transport system substrate-binding protein
VIRPTLALVLTLLLARCSGLPVAALPPRATPTPPPVTQLTVGYSAISGGNLPLWLAKEAGIFDKHNIDASLLLIPGGSAAMAALISNQVQISESGGSDALAVNVNGGDVVVVATPIPVYPYLLEVAPSIKSAMDLKGKKIGAGATGSSGDIATRLALRKLGLDPQRDLTIIAVQSRQTGTTALLNGALQGVIDDPPDSLMLDARGFHALFDMVELHLPAAQTAVMSRRDWVADNRGVMQAYVDARMEAIARTRQDKTFAVGVLKKYFKSDDDAAMSATYDYYVGKVLPAAPHTLPEQFKDALTELTRTNSEVRDFDVRTFLNDAFVRSAEARGLAAAG